MPLPIHVTVYSGYKANERPRDFTVDEDLYEIAEVASSRGGSRVMRALPSWNGGKASSFFSRPPESAVILSGDSLAGAPER